MSRARTIQTDENVPLLSEDVEEIEIYTDQSGRREDDTDTTPPQTIDLPTGNSNSMKNLAQTYDERKGNQKNVNINSGIKTKSQPDFQNPPPRRPYQPHPSQTEFSRHRYYAKLAPGTQEFVPPSWVIPQELFFPAMARGKYLTFGVIFAIVNTMVGSTILSLPWAFREAGLILGLAFFFVMASVSWYTATLILLHGGGEHDFSVLIKKHLGPSWNKLAKFSSVMVLIGATIAYHTIMTDCLLSVGITIGDFDEPWYWRQETVAAWLFFVLFPMVSLKEIKIFMKLSGYGFLFTFILESFIIYTSVKAFLDDTFRLNWDGDDSSSNSNSNPGATDPNIVNSFDDMTDREWTGQEYEDDGKNLIINQIALFAYQQFDGLIGGDGEEGGEGEDGMSVDGLLGSSAGNETTTTTTGSDDDEVENHFSLIDIGKSPHLLGVLALSFFIHNIVLTIMKNKPTTAGNNRDLGVAFAISGVCYLIPGVVAGTAFRHLSSLDQNYLNLFSDSDPVATVARVCTLFQLMTIYPLLLYIIKLEVFGQPTDPNHTGYHPNFFAVFAINVTLVGITTAFAAFYPNVGTVLRFSGAFCGLVYIFLIPLCMHLTVQRKTNKLTVGSAVGHGVLLLFGVSLLPLQFIS